MINDEPSAALKARGSEWGQTKVEHRSKGCEGWRECRTQSPITVSVIVPV